MALFECADCRQMISDRAHACPNCGCPVNEETIRESNLRKEREEKEIERQKLEKQRKLEKQKRTAVTQINNNITKPTNSSNYIFEYRNENEFRMQERAVKKYNMLAYKKLIFEYYPEFKKGNFIGTVVSENKNEGSVEYELALPTDSMFEKVHEKIKLHYKVYQKENIVMLDKISPEEILNNGHQKELTSYKGVMVSKNHREKDMFKINLLNMISRD